MVDIIEKRILQKHLARFLVDDVFETISESDILKVLTPTKWKYKNVDLTPGQITALRNQAIVLQNSDLWKILKEELRWRAQKRISMEHATSEEEIIASKLLIYLTDVIDSRLKSMAQDK